MENIYKERMETLISELNKYTELYDAGTPAISDKAWDDLYFQLIDLEKKSGIKLPNSPTQTIHYNIYSTVNKLEKCKHNHPMLSLDKTKDVETVEAFLKKQPHVAMCKMDGLTLSLRYLDGKLVSAETRGDGEIGEDVTHNAKIIPSIPNKITYEKELVLDGEIICTYSDFEEFSNLYKNPRNFASGSIRLLNSRECAKRNLTFIAWDVITGLDEYDKLIDKFITLKELGFKVVPTTFGMSIEEEIEEIKESAEWHLYPIDGVVFKFNDIEYGKTLGRTEHHFNNAIAYKFYDEVYDTKLRYIDWTMGRTGVLTPVAVFDAIDIDGTKVERASMHNVSIMKELLGDCAYAGQRLEVFKANQIIPQIKSAVKLDYGYVIANGGSTVDDLEICPCCGSFDVSIHEENGILNMYCDNPQCEGKLINKLDHFCSKKGLDIKGLSKTTLEKLIDWGFVSNFEDIFNLKNHKAEWVAKPGFGTKSVDRILAAVQDKTLTSTDRIISAAGIPLIGPAAAKELTKFCGTYSDFRQLVNDKFDFSTLNGFGEEMSNSILSFNYDEIDKAFEYLIEEFEETKEEVVSSQSLEGLTFVITGKLQTYKNRDEIKSIIEAAGGKVTGSVSGKTSYLINNDTESTTAKNKTAQSLGIPIITEKEFKEKFDL